MLLLENLTDTTRFCHILGSKTIQKPLLSILYPCTLCKRLLCKISCSDTNLRCFMLHYWDSEKKSVCNAFGAQNIFPKSILTILTLTTSTTSL